MTISRSTIVVSFAAVVLLVASISVVAFVANSNDEHSTVSVTLTTSDGGISTVKAEKIVGKLNENKVLAPLHATWAYYLQDPPTQVYTNNMPGGTVITSEIIEAINSCLLGDYEIDLTGSGITEGVTTFDQASTILLSATSP